MYLVTISYCQVHEWMLDTNWQLSFNSEKCHVTFFLSFFNTLLSLSGNMSHPTWVRLQQPQEQR